MGIGMAYFEGDTAELPINRFNDLKELGYVTEPTTQPPAHTTTTPIPKDIPGYKAIVAAGFTSLADVKAVPDLTEINGIGKVLAAQIVEYFKI